VNNRLFSSLAGQDSKPCASIAVPRDHLPPGHIPERSTRCAKWPLDDVRVLTPAGRMAQAGLFIVTEIYALGPFKE